MVEVLTFAVRVGGQSFRLKIGKDDYVYTVIERLQKEHYWPRGCRIYYLNPPTLFSEWDGEKGPEVDRRALLRSVIRGPFHPESVALIVQTHEEGMFGRYFFSTHIGVLTSSI